LLKKAELLSNIPFSIDIFGEVRRFHRRMYGGNHNQNKKVSSSKGQTKRVKSAAPVGKKNSFKNLLLFFNMSGKILMFF